MVKIRRRKQQNCAQTRFSLSLSLLPTLNSKLRSFVVGDWVGLNMYARGGFDPQTTPLPFKLLNAQKIIRPKLSTTELSMTKFWGSWAEGVFPFLFLLLTGWSSPVVIAWTLGLELSHFKFFGSRCMTSMMDTMYKYTWLSVVVIDTYKAAEKQAQKWNFVSVAQKEPHSQKTHDVGQRIFWTIRGHYPIKQGFWGKSRWKVHPKVRQNLCRTSSLGYLFCSWLFFVTHHPGPNQFSKFGGGGGGGLTLAAMYVLQHQCLAQVVRTCKSSRD